MRGMMPNKRREQPTVRKPVIQNERSLKVRPLPKSQPRDEQPQRVRVTMLKPWDKVYVGSRWYVVRKTRMIGRKSNRRSICIVYTMEKGGMHFRVTSKVLRAGFDQEN